MDFDEYNSGSDYKGDFDQFDDEQGDSDPQRQVTVWRVLADKKSDAKPITSVKRQSLSSVNRVDSSTGPRQESLGSRRASIEKIRQSIEQVTDRLSRVSRQKELRD